MTAQDQRTVEALSRAVLASDSGRRVGWARAYAAETSKDELSRDVNMARAERDIMRRSASFLYGFLTRYVEGESDAAPVMQQALRGHVEHIGAVLDSAVIAAGREAADALVHYSRSVGDRAADKKLRKEKAERLWKNARQQERKLLMEPYGIPNEAALYNYLEQYAPSPRR